MNYPDDFPTRDDFMSAEDWYRFLRSSGLILDEEALKSIGDAGSGAILRGMWELPPPAKTPTPPKKASRPRARRARKICLHCGRRK